eukprot:1159396-Pelagomonas_calceolata.AAC.1
MVVSHCGMGARLQPVCQTWFQLMLVERVSPTTDQPKSRAAGQPVNPLLTRAMPYGRRPRKEGRGKGEDRGQQICRH